MTINIQTRTKEITDVEKAISDIENAIWDLLPESDITWIESLTVKESCVVDDTFESMAENVLHHGSTVEDEAERAIELIVETLELVFPTEL